MPIVDYICRTLKKMKGIILHHTASNDMSKTMVGKMPDFESGLVDVYESNKIVNRRFLLLKCN